MERGQFYHYETYGRVDSKAKRKKNSSLYSILGEVFREPEYSSHVKKIDTDEHPPEIVFTDMEFKEGLDYKEKLLAQKTHLIGLAEMYAKAKKLRLVDGCILAGIVSYPPGTTLEMLNFLRVRSIIPFLKKKWGKNLRCIIGHSDEYFWDNEEKKREVHYQDHFYVILDAQSDIRLTNLHAGRAAKNKALASEIELKEEESRWIDKNGKFVMKANPIPKKEGKPENTNKRGKGMHSDRAYRDAMRQEQDEFFDAVGDPAGWERTTVRGVRYPREQVKAWKQNQREMEAQQKAVSEEAKRIESEAASERDRLIKEGQEEAERSKSEAAAERERLIKEGQKEAERIESEVATERERLIREGQEEAERSKSEAAAERARLIREGQEEAERIKSKAAAERDRIIKEGREEAERIKSEAAAEKVRLIREEQEKAERIKSEAAKKAEEIKNKAKEEAKEIINQAEKEAKETKKKAWKVASEIENGAKVQAESIIEKSRKFLNELLKKVAKLPGGTSIVKWAWTVFKPKKPDIQGNKPVRDNTQNNTQGKSR